MADYLQVQSVVDFLKHLSHNEIDLEVCADSHIYDLRVAFAFMISTIDDFCYKCSHNSSTPNILKGSVIMRIIFPNLVGMDTITCSSVKLCQTCFTQCTLGQSINLNQSECCNMLLLVEQHCQAVDAISDDRRMDQLCARINFFGSDQQIPALRQQIVSSIGSMPLAFTINTVPLGIIGVMLDGLDDELQRMALGLDNEDVLPVVSGWASGMSSRPQQTFV